MHPETFNILGCTVYTYLFNTKMQPGPLSVLSLTLSFTCGKIYRHARPIENHTTTRSTQRAQTSAERQHSRIAEWFLQSKLPMQLWSESTRYFFDNPVNPDFGLRSPRSGRWSGSSPKFNHLVTTLPLWEISSKSVHNFFSYPTDKQTDQSENITSFFGGVYNFRKRPITARRMDHWHLHALYYTFRCSASSYKECALRTCSMS